MTRRSLIPRYSYEYSKSTSHIEPITVSRSLRQVNLDCFNHSKSAGSRIFFATSSSSASYSRNRDRVNQRYQAVGSTTKSSRPWGKPDLLVHVHCDTCLQAKALVRWKIGLQSGSHHVSQSKVGFAECLCYGTLVRCYHQKCCLHSDNHNSKIVHVLIQIVVCTCTCCNLENTAEMYQKRA